MTQPQIERIRLLAQLTTSDTIPVLARYADLYIFSDITIMEWCITHDIIVQTAKVGSGQRTDGKPNVYDFYIFSLIPDHEW